MIKSKIKIRTKYVPAGIKILYEDRDIIVIDKRSGLLSVKANYEAEKTAHQLLTNYVRKGNPKSKINLKVFKFVRNLPRSGNMWKRNTSLSFMVP